jgi:hypothetical protein
MKDIILKIFKERYNNDKNSTSFSNLLNDYIDSIFSEPERIFYELLQNADDAGNSTDVRFNILLLDEYLVVNYNGKHFDENDLNSLCDITQSSKNKISDKIGYKGIGFKSVFRVSDLVYIRSGKNCCFRFDKDFENQGKMGYPWQIVPIWTEKHEIPDKIYSTMALTEDDGITIIIKIKPDFKQEDLKNKIKSVYGKYKILLFLRNVKEINLYENNALVLQSKRTDNGLSRELELSLGGKTKNHEHYIASEFKIEVPDEIRTGLKNLSKTECPDKIKNAKNTSITLASAVDKDGNFVIAGNNEIYVYLPTDIRKDFPFIINAEFLTNAKRSELLKTPNSWNNFLFRNLGICLFEWLGQIANSGNEKYSLQLPKLIREKYVNLAGWDETLKKAYNEGLEIGMNKVAFLPEQQSGNLVLLKDSVVDRTHYSNNFSDNIDFVKEEITHKFPTIKEPKVINPKLQDLAKLINLGAKEFNMRLLCSMLSRPGFKDKLSLTEEKKLIEFLSTTIEQVNSRQEQNSWNEALSETDFILTEENTFRTPKELFFPVADFDLASLPSQLSLVFVSSELISLLDKKALQWLERLGVLLPISKEIISRCIGEFLAKGMLNNNNVIEISRYIFENRSFLSDKEYELLRKELKVLTKDNQLIIGWKCYLSDIYAPELCIEKLISEKIDFVSEEYLNNKEDETAISNWYSFFKKLSIQTRMIPVEWSVRLTPGQVRTVPEGEVYCKYLRQEGLGSNFEIENFFKLTLLDSIGNNYNFALHFWEIISNDKWVWDLIRSASKKYKFYENTKVVKKEKLLTYFQFYVRNVNCIPGIDSEELYSGKEIYSNRFKNILSGLRPVVALELTHDIEEHLGIITELSPELILSLLSEFATTQTFNADILKRISLLYERLALEWKSYSEEDKGKFQVWSAEHSLLSEANSFEPVANLYFFDLTNFIPPQQSVHFMKFSGQSHEHQLQIAQLFGVRAVKEEDLIFSCKKPVSNAELAMILKERVSAISFLSHSEYGGEFEEILSAFKNTLSNYKFFGSDSLLLKFLDGEQEIYRTGVNAGKEGQKIYHTGNWEAPEVLYELIPILCDIFGLRNQERELQLVLTLDDNTLIKWLLNAGAENQVIELLKKTTETENLRPKAIVVNPHATKTAEPETDYDVEEPIIPELINTFPSPENFLPDEEEYDLTDIGWRGEKYVYELLLEQNPNKTIIWENESSESQKAFDIKIQGNPDEYIEVKSTISNYSTGFYLSEKEFKMMVCNSKNYKIYRVHNLNSIPAYQILTADDIQFVQFKDGLIAMIGEKK